MPKITYVGQKFKRHTGGTLHYEVVKSIGGHYRWLVSDQHRYEVAVNDDGQYYTDNVVHQLLGEEISPVKLQVGKTYQNARGDPFHIIKKNGEFYYGVHTDSREEYCLPQVKFKPDGTTPDGRVPLVKEVV